VPSLTVTGSWVIKSQTFNPCKRLPVLRGTKVIGIVSRANLLRALASLLRAAARPAKSDDAIRARILSELKKRTWSAGVVVDVLVRKGIVDVWGRVDEGPQRDAAHPPAG
jgi:predicted transcriptional regulator